MLRPATDDDLAAIAQMAADALPEAWPQQVLQASLTLEHHQLVVVEQPATLLAGYYLASHIAPDWELLQLVVHRDCRRQGIGSLLLHHLTGCLQPSDHLTLEVRASNTAAITLYRHHGFRTVTTRKDYYRPAAPGQQREDAIIMQIG